MKSSSAKQLEFEKRNRRYKVNAVITMLDEQVFSSISTCDHHVGWWEGVAQTLGMRVLSRKSQRLILARLRRRANRRYK